MGSSDPLERKEMPRVLSSPDSKSRSTIPAVWSRRSFLAGSVALIVGRNVRPVRATQADPLPDPADAEEIAQFTKAARAAKLGSIRHSTSDHFLGIGDSPDAFRQSALRHCEGLGQAFLTYFRGRG